MSNKELAEIMYPNLNKSVDYYERKYLVRNLKDGAIVTRFAPSPTGFVHMGSLLTAFIARKMAKDTEGVFYLRIEDTDQKRSLENGIQGIIDDLKNFDIEIDEGVISEKKEIEKRMKLPKFRKAVIAEVSLKPKDGMIKKTFGVAHYSWWRTNDFDVSQAKVIAYGN